MHCFAGALLCQHMLAFRDSIKRWACTEISSIPTSQTTIRDNYVIQSHFKYQVLIAALMILGQAEGRHSMLMSQATTLWLCELTIRTVKGEAISLFPPGRHIHASPQTRSQNKDGSYSDWDNKGHFSNTPPIIWPPCPYLHMLYP